MRFIESTDTQQGMPPFSFPGVSMTTFLLEADLEKLVEYCDKFLNLDDRHYFRPITGHVYLGINKYPRMYSDCPGQEDVGYVSQNEYYVTFPVVRYEILAGSFLLGRELTWAFPYIGVDDSTSAFTGQEVLGFQKLCGAISVKTKADHSFSAEVSMPAFRAPGRAQRQQLLPLVNIKSGPPALWSKGGALPSSFMELGRELREIDDLVVALYEMVEPGASSVINLKQFRDGADPEMAIYQALVRCEWTIDNVRDPVRYEGAEIDVFDNATIRIIESLGLSANGSRLEPLMGIGMTADMRFGKVTTLSVLS